MKNNCTRCNIKLTIENWYPSRRKQHTYFCIVCCKEMRKKYKSYNSPSYMKTYMRKYHKLLRESIIRKYGGKCQCCGEIRKEFLGIDHINGGGNKHHKIVGSGTKFLIWIRKNNYPQILRVLCHNCNLARGFYGACPHEGET